MQWSTSGRAGSWRRWLAVALCLVFTLPNLVYPLFEDTALFFAIGELMHRGAQPYADLFDQKPPGIYLWTWSVTGLFGASSLAARVSEIVVTVAMAVAVGRVARASGLAWAEEAGIALTGLWASTAFWGLPELGQVELYEAAAMAGGAAFVVSAFEQPRRRSLLLAGALLSLACWFKPQAVLFAALVTALVGARFALESGWRTGLQRAGLIALGAISVSAAFVAWMTVAGILDDFVEVIRFNADYLARVPRPSLGHALQKFLPAQLRADPWLTRTVFASMLAAVVVLVRRGSRERWLLALLGAWWLSAFAQLASGRFLFDYHALIGVPVIAASLAVAVGAFALGVARVLGHTENRMLRLGAGGAALVAVWIVLGPTPRWHSHRQLLQSWLAGEQSRAEIDRSMGRERHYYRFDVQRDAAELIRARTEPGDRVQVIGRAGAFYLFADRLPASRLLVTTPAFKRDLPVGERLFRELVASLEAQEPAYILVRLDDAFPWFGVEDSWTETRGTEIETMLAEDYVDEGEFEGSFRLFRRRDPD